ncbi:rCG37597, partial [Rattus norvegicus]
MCSFPCCPLLFLHMDPGNFSDFRGMNGVYESQVSSLPTLVSRSPRSAPWSPCQHLCFVPPRLMLSSPKPATSEPDCVWRTSTRTYWGKAPATKPEDPSS